MNAASLPAAHEDGPDRTEKPLGVRFPDEPPVFDGANMLMRFVVELDGESAVCAITAEALEDHFGAQSALEASLRDAFRNGRERIHATCAEAIRETGGSVVLHSGRFRVQGG